MPNSYFRFKQFTVRQDRCAMKVGTDGVLLGAWAPLQRLPIVIGTGNASILDIGTGTGLIALMLAQRAATAAIDAIEIDPAACEQAQENVSHSPFADRIRVTCTALQRFQPAKTYDLITCNPPYFQNSLKNPDPQRSTARHDTDLTLEELFFCAAPWLAHQGQLALILPAETETRASAIASAHQLLLTRKTGVYPTPTGVAKRYLLAFSNQPEPLTEDTLIIEQARHQYSLEYRKLTSDFYL